MGISFGSIGTGLPKDIVQQIMAAERLSVNKMEERKVKIDEKAALVNQLSGLVGEMKNNIFLNNNTRGLRELKVETDERFVSVTPDKALARPGSYQFEVIQLARKSSAITNGLPDKDKTSVGVGFIQYELPNGDNKDVYIDSDNSTLEDIARLINSDDSNGMRANVINDNSGSDTPWKMIISLEDTGDEKRANFPAFYLLDGWEDLYLEEEREAQDAKVKLDGFEMELPENKTSELIPGLTINLKKAAPGEEFPIIITEDTEAVTAKIKEIVDKINSVLEFIIKQNDIDGNSDTSNTLGGDIVLQTLESRIRNTIFTPIETSFGPKRFGDLGVEFQRSGLLRLDEKKFNAALSENYVAASQLLTGYFDSDGVKKPGFLNKLEDTIDTILRRPDGLLMAKKRGFKSQLNTLDRSISDRERMLEQKEQMLKMRFSKLEETVAKLKAQGNSLGSMGAGGVSVPQLG